MIDIQRISLRIAHSSPAPSRRRLRAPRAAAAPVPPGTAQPDKFLFDKGNEALQKKKWLTAREFFKQVTETYTQSPFRPDAKLGIGDTYLGEGSTEALVLAINEFQEFLSFYPTNRARRLRAVQAGHGALPADAVAAARSDRNARRDQRVPDLRRRGIRTAADARSEGEAARSARSAERSRNYQVGHFYYRQRWYPGAIDRLNLLLKDDPEFTGRDEVYFYLGESLLKVERQAEALPYFEKAGRRNSSRASTSKTRASGSPRSRIRRAAAAAQRAKRRPNRPSGSTAPFGGDGGQRRRPAG